MKKVFVVIIAGLACAWSSCAQASMPTRQDTRTVIPFDGTIDFRQERMTVRFSQGQDSDIALEVRRSPADTLQLTLDVRHLKASLFDLAGVVQADLKFTGTDRFSREMAGEVTSHYTLVNHKPVRDLYLKFAVRDQKLVIDSFLVGTLSGRGQLELVGDHRADLTFEIISTDLGTMADMVRDNRMMIPEVSGVLSGAFDLTGPILKPKIKGRLGLYDGSFMALSYESLLLQFEGTYPTIRLDDSLVTHTEGFSFKIIGSVDLSDLSRLPYQTRQLEKVPIVTEAKDRREWVFKRQRLNKDSVTEMKYLLLKDDRGDAEGVLGFEKRIGF